MTEDDTSNWKRSDEYSDYYTGGGLVAQTPHMQDFIRFLPELSKESDRGNVLISLSFIDEQLKAILLAFLIEDKNSKSLVDGFNAPLGSLSTRMSMARALGLITEREFNDCTTLRKIRNQFAHEIHTSFETPSVVDLCANLKMSAPMAGDAKLVAKSRFTSSSISIILNFTNRSHFVSTHRRHPKAWPRDVTELVEKPLSP